MTTPLRSEIDQLVTNALHNNDLDDSLTADMVPTLVEALEPHLQRYISKHSSFPEPKTFRAIVNNFIRDGVMVHAFLNLDTIEAIEWWQDLRKKLMHKTQQGYPDLSPADLDEIVAATQKRIQRYLPNFLFIARLSTWVDTIWRNECNRLLKQIIGRQEKETSLDKEDVEGHSLGERLESPGPSPEDRTAHSQTIEDLWERINNLGNEVDVRILRLHLAGHTLEEIKLALGEKPLSIATIKRRIDRTKQRMKEDELIKEIARRLGILEE